MDGSTVIGVLFEPWSAIVIHSSHRVRPSFLIGTMFTVRVTVNHYLVSNGVGVLNAGRIFASIVLKDELLLTILDVLPVSLERDALCSTRG